MKTYICTRNVHCGELFQEGDEIELEDKDADPLLEVGAIKDPAEKDPKPARTPKKVVPKK